MAPTSDAAQPSPAEPPLPALQASATSGVRVTSYALMGGGGAAVVAGAIVYAIGAPNRARFAELRTGDGKFYPPADPRHREALDLMGRVDTNSTLSFGLFGAGLGAAAAGLATYLLFPPGGPVSMSAAPSRDGAVVTIQGRF